MPVALVLTSVGVILALDWLTPAGVVVAILLGIPIVLASLSDRPRDIWLVTGTAIVGFVVAAAFGREAITPPEVWVPNRILAFLTLPAAGGLAVVLQRRRLRLEQAQREALASSDLNRLLFSLLAHDLRAPVGTALQTIDYLVEGTPPDEIDTGLVDDARKSLRRSLGAIDNILSLSRDAEGQSSERAERSGREIAGEIETEVMSFGDEARARGKRLHVEVAGGDERRYAVDLLVLRQCVAILVDNAVRHAVPGSVRVTAVLGGDQLRVRVEDEGPGLKSEGSGAAGSGLGLDLSRALVDRAGGSLDVVRDEVSGTTFDLRMPLLPRSS